MPFFDEIYNKVNDSLGSFLLGLFFAIRASITCYNLDIQPISVPYRTPILMWTSLLSGLQNSHKMHAYFYGLRVF